MRHPTPSAPASVISVAVFALLLGVIGCASTPWPEIEVRHGTAEAYCVPWFEYKMCDPANGNRDACPDDGSPPRFAMWIDPRRNDTRLPPITGERSTSALVGTAAHRHGPPIVTKHPTFTEYAWPKNRAQWDRAEFLANGMPSIALVGATPDELVPMWAAVSGIDVHVESPPPESLQTVYRGQSRILLSRLRARLPDNRAFENAEPLLTPVPLVFVTTSKRANDPSALLTVLAAAIGCRVENEGETVRLLLDDDPEAIRQRISRVKEDPYVNPLYSLTGYSLARLGRGALPFLLEEYQSAGGYYRNALARILAAIPSPERDAAFLRTLETSVGENLSDNWLLRSILPDLFASLACNGCRAAAPLLLAHATQTPGPYELVPGYARIALNILDNPVGDWRDHADSRLTWDIAADNRSSVRNDLKDIADAVCLHGLFDGGEDPVAHSYESYGPSAGSVSGVFAEGHYDNSGAWELVIGCPDEQTAIAHYYYWRAPLAAAAYVGELVRRDDSWLVIDWREVWLS